MFPKIDDSRECRLKLIKLSDIRGREHRRGECSRNTRGITSESTLQLKEIDPSEHKILLYENGSRKKKCICCQTKKNKMQSKLVIRKNIASYKSDNNIGNLFHSCSKNKYKDGNIVSVINVEDENQNRKYSKQNKKYQNKWVNKIIKKILLNQKIQQPQKTIQPSKIISINGKYYEVLNQNYSNNNSNLVLVEQQKRKQQIDQQQKQRWQSRASDRMKFRQYLDNQVAQYMKYQTIFHLIKIGKYKIPGRQNDRYVRYKSSVSQKLSLYHQKESSQEEQNNQVAFSNTNIDRNVRENLSNYYSQSESLKETYMIKFPTLENVQEMIQKYESLTGWVNPKTLVTAKEYYREYSCMPGKEMLYFGCWDSVKNEKSGYGVYVTKNIILEGLWVGNKLSKGAELRSLSLYKGQFMNNRKHGEGECKWLNGEEYLGEWKNGLRHGQGCWSSKHGSQSYSGEWLQGKVTGYGQYFLKNYSVYKGFFNNFMKVGNGVEVFVNGDKYEGEYLDGHPNGKGTYTWQCGLVYRGEFKNGKREGRGQLQKQQIFEIQGQFQNERPNGICRLKLVNGDTFNGKFVYGVKYGFGAMQYQGTNLEQAGFWYNNLLKQRVSSQNYIYQTKCE